MSKSRKKLGLMEEKNMDHISQLPEPILQKIISSLLAVDVAQMSTFSKTWSSVWRSHPYLNFGDEFLCYEKDLCLLPKSDILKFVNVVEQTVMNRHKQNVSIHRFWIKVPHLSDSYVHGRIPIWIKTLVACNIKELILEVIPRRDVVYTILPEEVFAAKELSLLHLNGFKLELPYSGIDFSSLRELKLSNTFLDELCIQALCASCCYLEDLTLFDCHGLASLRIAGTLPKLRKVRLSFFCEVKMVDVVVPNLEYLHIASYQKLLVDLGITACKALKGLYLICVHVSDKGLEDIFSSLPYLEALDLIGCGPLKTMKISSDRLKHLAVSECIHLIAVKLDTPNLTSFSYACYDDQLPILILRASILLEVELNFYRRQTVFDIRWYSKLIKFLGNFNKSKAIKIRCYHENAIVIPKDMRNKLVPLYGTDRLRIEFSLMKSYSAADVLDSLLWISRQLDTLTFVRDSGLKSTLKFIYDDASDEAQKTCGVALPVKCWSHNLKEVKMENFAPMEQHELRCYLSRVKVR